MKGLRQGSLEDLYVAVGNGALGPKEVVQAVYPSCGSPPRAADAAVAAAARRRGVRAGRRAGRRDADQRPGHRDGGPLRRLLPPAAGRSDRRHRHHRQGRVTIHTNDCQTLESFAATPERFIDVDWDLAGPPAGGGAKASHTGRISVIATDAPNTLANLTNAISKQDGSVSNLRIVNRQQDFFEILVDVEVRDVRHLSNVIAGLRAASGITQVERARGVSGAAS